MQRWLQSQLVLLATTSPLGGARKEWFGALAHLDAWRSFASGNSDAGRQGPKSGERRLGVDKKGSDGAPKSPQSPLELLQRFRATLRPTPPVSFIRGMPAPTALSWLRRRGPQVPHAVLHRLFRQRQVRLFDGSRVVRVRPSRPLRNGDLLLYPLDLSAAAGTASPGAPEEPGEEADGSRRQTSHAAAGPGPGSSGSGSTTGRPSLFAAPSARSGGAAAAAGAGAAGLLSAERVRRWVLGVHPGLLFINKPAGVRVHGRAAGDADGGGGRGGAPSLDAVMGRALRFGEHDEPRLVHRLDQQASGVMVVARNADAATWLAAAFSGKARQALADADEEERGLRDGRRRGASRRGDEDDNEEEDGGGSEQLHVRRTYWAFLAGDLQPRQTGRIRFPVLVDGVFQPAVSSYRVRATGCGVTWVELTPETGRRHQLRVHCARKLGAPIIGDSRYGYHGLPPRLALRDRLPPEWWALLG
ncbi:hypothetical protein Agub_g1964, partial [Astrephomene gubernaculifera]